MSLQEKKISSDINVDVVSIAPTESENNSAYEFTIAGASTDQQHDDRNFIMVPIRIAELEDLDEVDPVVHESHKKSFLDKLRGSDKGVEFKMVRMTRDEYRKYWAKDEKGNYIGTEPRGLGAARLRKGADGASSMTLTRSDREPVKQNWKDYLAPHNVINAMGVAATGGVGI